MILFVGPMDIFDLWGTWDLCFFAPLLFALTIISSNACVLCGAFNDKVCGQ
jgi:hypothetical protein